MYDQFSKRHQSEDTIYNVLWGVTMQLNSRSLNIAYVDPRFNPQYWGQCSTYIGNRTHHILALDVLLLYWRVPSYPKA